MAIRAHHFVALPQRPREPSPSYEMNVNAETYPHFLDERFDENGEKEEGGKTAYLFDT